MWFIKASSGKYKFSYMKLYLESTNNIDVVTCDYIFWLNTVLWNPGIVHGVTALQGPIQQWLLERLATKGRWRNWMKNIDVCYIWHCLVSASYIIILRIFLWSKTELWSSV